MRRLIYGGGAVLLAFAAGVILAIVATDRKDRRALADRAGSDLARLAEITDLLASNDIDGAKKIIGQEIAWRNDVLLCLREQDPAALDAIRPALQAARRTFAYQHDPAFNRILDWEAPPVDRARVAFEEKVLAPAATAPELSTSDWIGPSSSLAQLRGKVVLLDFWATSCGPCVAGMPKLQSLQEEFGDQGLVVLAVHAAQSRDKVERFVREKSIRLPVAIDTGRTFEDYGVHALPTKALIDKGGRVVWSPDVLEPSQRAMTEEEDLAELREQIRKALAG